MSRGLAAMELGFDPATVQLQRLCPSPLCCCVPRRPLIVFVK